MTPTVGTALSCTAGTAQSRRSGSLPCYRAAMRIVVLIILALASFAVSRLLLALVGDPEGPNLLITSALALILFCTAAGVRAVVARARRRRNPAPSE